MEVAHTKKSRRYWLLEDLIEIYSEFQNGILLMSENKDFKIHFMKFYFLEINFSFKSSKCAGVPIAKKS